jgi:hypothetical protein
MKKPLLALLLLAGSVLFTAPAMFAQTDGPVGNAARLQRLVEEPEKPYRHQIFQNDINFDPTENYVVTFWAKSTVPTRLSVSTKNGAPPWGYFGLRENIAISTQWQRYELPFKAANAIPGKSRLTFTYGNKDAVSIWIADTAIQLAGRDRPKDNLLADGRFEKGLGAWLTDGRQAGVFSVDIFSIASVDKDAAASSGN